MKVGKDRYDKTGGTRVLRAKVSKEIKSAIRKLGMSTQDLSERIYESLGYNNAGGALGFLISARTGKCLGASTEVSKNFIYTPTELEKLARLFRILTIDENNPVFQEVSQSEPEFSSYYRKFGRLDGEFDSQERNDQQTYKTLMDRLRIETQRQTNTYARELQKRYDDCKIPEQRREFLRDLEGYLNYLEGEGIFHDFSKKREG